MIPYLALIISALAGLIGAWKEVFIGSHTNRKTFIKVVSTLLILITFGVGWIVVVRKSEEVAIFKEKSRKDSIAKVKSDKELSETLDLARRNKVIVGDISDLSKAINDTLDKTKERLSTFSKLQNKELQQVYKSTIASEYPIPDKLKISIDYRFDVDSIIANKLNKQFNNLTPLFIGDWYTCTNNDLEIATASHISDVFYNLKLSFISKDTTLDYEAFLKLSHDYNTSLNLYYSTTLRKCEIMGEIDLAFNRNSKAKNFKQFAICDLQFSSSFLESLIKLRTTDSLGMNVSFYDNKTSFFKKLAPQLNKRYFLLRNAHILE